MAAARLQFSRVVDTLAKFYGEPNPPTITDPFQMILWENIAYLANDVRRVEAFDELRKEVGLRPADIRKASQEALLSITSKGIVPENSVDKLRRAAEIARESFDDDVASVLRKPEAAAKKDLRKFPSIGEPAAEKILLFNRKLPVVAMDSNALRVLVRLGFTTEKKSYSNTYKTAQQAVGSHATADCDVLIRASQLLRQHGQELCKRSNPPCPRRPLRTECAFFAEAAFPS